MQLHVECGAAHSAPPTRLLEISHVLRRLQFGKIACDGGGSAPNTVVEFDLDSNNGLEFYDVSLVDEFNLPVVVVPVSGSGSNLCEHGVREGFERSVSEGAKVKREMRKWWHVRTLAVCSERRSIVALEIVPRANLLRSPNFSRRNVPKPTTTERRHNEHLHLFHSCTLQHCLLP
ncbi:hypothetical protein ACSQ67_011533 [Phaseolus vulgaris]